MLRARTRSFTCIRVSRVHLLQAGVQHRGVAAQRKAVGHVRGVEHGAERVHGSPDQLLVLLRLCRRQRAHQRSEHARLRQRQRRGVVPRRVQLHVRAEGCEVAAASHSVARRRAARGQRRHHRGGGDRPTRLWAGRRSAARARGECTLRAGARWVYCTARAHASTAKVMRAQVVREGWWLRRALTCARRQRRCASRQVCAC